MAGGRMLREKRITAVKQSSSWMRFFSKLCLPQVARFSYPASPVAPHKWLPHLLAKKNSPNWKSRWFQTTGPQVAPPCLRLFTGFMLLLSPGLRALLKAYLGVYIYFEIDEDVESHPAKNVICLFCPGIVWQMEAVTQRIPAKVTERCRVLSWGRPELLLHVNLDLPFHSLRSMRRTFPVYNSFSPCLNI